MTTVQISILTSIGSLVLGAGAWFFAALAIAAKKSISSYRHTTLSFCACVLSLLLQLFEINNRVNVSDYAAIEDTIRAVLIASVALIAVTIILNILALSKAAKR